MIVLRTHNMNNKFLSIIFSILLFKTSAASLLSNMKPSDVRTLISLKVLESHCKNIHCEGSDSTCISKMKIGGSIFSEEEFCYCGPERTGKRCEYHLDTLGSSPVKYLQTLTRSP